ncbi:uncharacterized protein LDX57_009658 [Aspergillus melleus]|uniref:uncharacterized protein n=1 Tax=Aspergillus melleus TaxID=138277 RepID=UPI001E8D9BA7|nr:uncharacterized protein LDX57_009658 [Aspergillus melleus]KAH8432011.1 hypothetical protein LDX57_009658 [Aspergillus melleus]
MLQVVSDIDAAPCHFPTESLGNNDVRGFKSIPVALDSLSTTVSSDTLLRAWAVVLRYYAGSDIICFGRVDDTTDASLRFALCHGDIPIDTALEAIQPSASELAGDSSTSASLKEWMESKASINSLVWNSLAQVSESHLQDLQSAQCPLAIFFSSTSEQQVTLAYASHTIGETIASSVAEALARVVNAIIDAPQTPIGELDLFGPSSWNQIHEWNNTVPDMFEACLHELIDERATTCPDSTALECWDGSVSYVDLVDYTSRLGNFLISQNVGPDVFVPVCFDKSLWAVVSMLGVLKAGGAFVCIDPAQPIDRLSTIIEEVDARIALAAPEHCGKLSEALPQVIAVDSALIHQLPPCPDLPRRASPHDAAYAIFTSGSTGKPKGIVQEHRAVCSSAKEHASRLNINPETRTFQFAAYTFIVNTFELFTPLVEGGCVCVPSKEDRLGRTTGAMRDLRANWACLTPSFLRSLKPGDLPDLKTLLLAGEPVQQDNLDTWRSRVQMLNMYGASEASVCVTGDLSGPVGRSTIGRGVGVCTWVTDVSDHDRLAPIGAIGELVVEGPVLAREYIHLPDKTAAAFIANTPWLKNIRGEEPLYRAYKTGDLVRYGSDGRINLVGRKDMQVKLRGQRIELEEVEFHLRQALPRGLEISVGLVRPSDQPDRPFLAAFVALSKGFADGFNLIDQESAEKIDSLTADWKALAAQALPGYMIPSTLVKLKHMPLTASGKTNRKSLTDFASQLTLAALTGATKGERKEPATTTGKELRKMWAGVLEISEETISADDSFLQLGGNSIDAMKLVNVARDGGIGLSVAGIFTHPTLDKMAEASSTMEQLAFEDVPFSLLPEGSNDEELVGLAANQCGVDKSAIEDLYPCTALQAGLLALSDSRDGAYVAQHSLKLPAASVDLDKFKQACQQVVTAHPILRTRIIYPPEFTALQAVLLGDIDWRSAETLEEYLQTDKQQPMKAGDALTRYGLVPDSDGWTFVWTVHHAVYDAWTLELVFDRIDKAYKGQAPEKDTTFKQFMSYVVNTDEQAADEFWRQYLKGAVRTEFPCVVSTAKQPVADASLHREMKLNRPEQLSGITMPSIIRAAWGMIVGSHSESDDVVFGGIVSGRNAPVPDADRLVGPGIAALPVRVKVPESESLTVFDFVRSVQSEATAMIEFEQTGLQNISRLSTDANSACDFQTLLVVQPAKEKAAVLEEPDLRNVSEANANFGTYALTLECSLKADGVSCAAHYDSDLISEDYVERVLGQLGHLLYQMCSSSGDKKMSDLVLLGPQDLANIREWNQEIPGRIDRTIHDLIGDRIAERPDHEAVCSWDGSFTYSELDQHSARLARRLAQSSVGPETFVPCCFEKSRWAPVAMLAVLRAGGAFLNIDPSQPPNRIQLMIQKLKAKTIVCSPRQYELCASLGDYDVVVLDEQSPDAAIPETVPVNAVGPENAAYVIFTSGSTGEPKGTIIQHGSYCSGSTTHAPAMLMDRDTRALQFASFTFDASLVEILTVLIIGGTVCFASEEQRKRDVTEAVRNLNANWAALTPSFVNLINPDDVPGLKVLILAGEAMSQSHLETWAHRVRLVNGYGPSECCVASTSNWDLTINSSPRNVGRACSGASWVVMPNNHHRLVPVGSVGELVMEGWNVGRGYLDEPEKTQAAFVENPRWLDPTDDTRPPMVYKTGDLVRYNPDGTLRFERRKDTQVKLRGQRVELGEIEYRIKQSLPNKPDAVVDIVCAKDAVDQPRLVAFLPVSREDAMETLVDVDAIIPPPDEHHVAALSGLEDRMADFLPMHMIPNTYLPVYYIPKLPSGKADRKTLKRVGGQLTHREMAQYSGTTEEARPPTTEMQLTLQQLWGECLKMSAAQISLNDNFIRLGGDSITAMRLASAARSRDIPLSTASVFQHPTLEAMSAVAETLTQQKLPQTFEPFSSVKSIPKDKLLDDIVLPQVGVPAFQVEDVVEATDFQTLAINGGLNQTRGWSNYLVFDFNGPVDLRRLQNACDKLVAQHAVLRTVFVTTGFQLLQVILRSCTPEVTFHIQDDQDPSEALVREDLARTPRLGEPIVRFMVVKNGAVKHRVIMRVSHAQYDGSSMPLLMQDLGAAYKGDELTPRPQFSDFVRMQLHTSDGAESFYKEMLAGSSMTQLVSHSKMSTTNVLNTMIVEMVPLIAFKEHGITSATVVKAAWAMTLAEMACTSDVVYGHMVSGRNLPLNGVESVMGPCLNIVPVRANMETMATVQELLQLIQQQQTDTIPHESLGFRQIIDQCTNWSKETRFSTVFQYQEFGGEDVTQPITMEGKTTVVPGFICPSPDACDMSILATPVGEQVRIEMIFSTHAMSRSFADATLQKLSARIKEIARTGVEGRMPSFVGEPQIPLPEPGRRMTNGVNGMVGQIVNGINAQNGVNGVSNGVNGVHEESAPEESYHVNLLASVPL